MQIQRQNIPALAVAAAMGLAAVFTLPALLLWEPAATHSVLMAALFILLALMGARLLASTDRRLKGFSLGFGFLFGLCQLTGYRLDAAGTVGGGLAPLWLLTASLAFTPALGFLFAAFVRLCGRAGRRQPPAWPARRVFAASLGVIALCWLPYYLAYFPGMFNFDAAGEASQFLSGSYDGAFPPFHTMLLAGFYFAGQALGSPNIGIALYTAAQVLALAASIAYALAYLNQSGCPRAFCGVMTAALALLPCFPLLAVSTTKDIFFTALTLLLLVRLHMAYVKPELWRAGKQWVWVGLLTGGICLMRPNGIVGIILLLAAGFLLLGKSEARKRFCAVVLCGIALYGGVNAGLKLCLKPAPSGIREMLSLPLSQVARVYVNAQETGTPLPEAEEILAFIPDAHRYQRHLADGVKRHTTVGMVNMPQFLDLWGRLLIQYPAQFVDAAAYLSKGYWHLDDLTHLDIYAERGAHGYMETANQDGYGVERRSLLPGLMTRLDEYFVENRYKEIPILSAMIEPAFWCWLLWAVIWMAAYRRDKGVLFCSAMLLGLYITLLLGACAYIRYAYPLAVCALPLLGLCLAKPAALPDGGEPHE